MDLCCHCVTDTFLTKNCLTKLGTNPRTIGDQIITKLGHLRGYADHFKDWKYTEIIAYRSHFEVIVETSFFFQLRINKAGAAGWLNITFWGVFPCLLKTPWSCGDPIGTCVHTCNIFGAPGFSGVSVKERLLYFSARIRRDAMIFCPV